MDGEVIRDDLGHQFYVAHVISGTGSVTIHLPAEEVEGAVAFNTKIEPHLEGGSLYLRFVSPGDGFVTEYEAFDGRPEKLVDLVEAFLTEDTYLSREEYKKALVDLYQQLDDATEMTKNFLAMWLKANGEA